MDFLALANSSINFALYCAMSRQFRTEFQKLLGVKILKNWIPMVENFAGTSYIVTQVIKFLGISDKMKRIVGSNKRAFPFVTNKNT